MEADQKGDKPASSAQIIMGASWCGGRWGRARTRLAMDARRCRTAAGVPRAEGGEGLHDVRHSGLVERQVSAPERATLRSAVPPPKR
jgi:hypothetical protein